MRRALSLVAASLLLAGAAAAQIDPQPDGIGVYFHGDCETNCLEGLALDTHGPGFAQVALTNATVTSGICGYEFKLLIEGPAIVTERIWPPGALDIGTPPDHVVGLAVPLPWAPCLTLLDLSLLIYDSGPVYFYVCQVWGPLVPSGCGDYVPCDEMGEPVGLNSATGECCLVPVASINAGDCPVPAAGSTWGGLKTLYR